MKMATSSVKTGAVNHCSFNHYTVNHSSVKVIISTAMISLMLFCPSIEAAHALPEFEAQYAIQKFGIKLAEATYKLSYTDTGYKFNQDTKLYGVASMFDNSTVSAVSLVDEVGDNLLLIDHKYIQTGSKKNKNEEFSILWNTHKNMLSGVITGTVRGEKIKLNTDSEIWEILSFQIPLMIEATESIKEYPYKAILKGEINTYNFVLSAKENIQFAGKDYQTLKMVRTDPNKDRQLYIWLIPKLNNIPVIIENYRDGKEHSRMQLESVKFNSEKPIIQQDSDDDDL